MWVTVQQIPTLRLIQCSALTLIRDHPHFLVLFLAMQRFENQLWRDSTTAIIEDDGEGYVDLILDRSSKNRIFHCGLNGRVTTVFPVILKKVYEITF